MRSEEAGVVLVGLKPNVKGGLLPIEQEFEGFGTPGREVTHF